MSDSNSLPSDAEVRAWGDLCQSVGFCLLQFSKVEESLSALYGTAAGIPKMETAFRTHDEIREFQYRLGATSSAVRFWISSLPDEKAKEQLSAEWNSLERAIKEDSQERNRIAHFTIAPDEHADGTSTWYVCPYFQMFSHLTTIRGQPGEEFRIPDGVRKFDYDSMQAKITRFGRTASRIDRFINQLLEHGAQLPQSS